MQPLLEQEIRCKELTESLIKANSLFERGDDKLACMVEDEVYEQMDSENIPVINRFLKQLGSTQQIEQK